MFVKFICPKALWTESETYHNPRSYPIPTLEAVRGMLKSIYWHPGIEYAIKKIQICSPIEYGTEKRNEKKAPNARTQKLYTFLKNYSFIVEFRVAVAMDKVKLNEGEIPTPGHVRAKTESLILRRIERQAGGRPVVAGQMQFPVLFESVDSFEEVGNPVSFTVSGMYVCLNHNTNRPVIANILVDSGIVKYDSFNLFSWNECEVL